MDNVERPADLAREGPLLVVEMGSVALEGMLLLESVLKGELNCSIALFEDSLLGLISSSVTTTFGRISCKKNKPAELLHCQTFSIHHN